MKIQVRKSVFETNSSSTHALAIFNGDEWEAFKEGRMVIENSPEADKLINIADIKDKTSIFNPDHIDEDKELYDYKYIPYSVWNNILDYDYEGWESIVKEIPDSNGKDKTIVVSTYQGC